MSHAPVDVGTHFLDDGQCAITHIFEVGDVVEVRRNVQRWRVAGVSVLPVFVICCFLWCGWSCRCVCGEQ